MRMIWQVGKIMSTSKAQHDNMKNKYHETDVQFYLYIDKISLNLFLLSK